MNESFRQMLRQVPLLLALSILLALGANFVRQTPLPLIGDRPPAARLTDGAAMTVSVERAGQLFERRQAIFIDARPRWQYEQGHIAGALNLPWQEVVDLFTDIAADLHEEVRIITYCDGESCTLSHDLALFLADMGYVRVQVLANGWTAWRQAGLPVEEGAHE